MRLAASLSSEGEKPVYFWQIRLAASNTLEAEKPVYFWHIRLIPSDSEEAEKPVYFWQILSIFQHFEARQRTTRQIQKKKKEKKRRKETEFVEGRRRNIARFVCISLTRTQVLQNE